MRWIFVLAIFSLSGCATSSIDLTFGEEKTELYKFEVKTKSFDPKTRNVDFLLLHDGDIFDILNTQPSQQLEALESYMLEAGTVRIEVYERNSLKMEAEFPLSLCDERGGDAIIEVRPTTEYSHGLQMEYGCIGAPLIS